MKRLKHIDTAKGLGIILVVWGHSLIEFGYYIIYMFHMPLFFYLSGIFHRQGGYVELLSKKFRGLIVPLVIFMVILFPVSYMVDDQCAVNLAPPHLRGVFGPLWFLISLFFLSAIYHPMLKFRPAVRLVVCIGLSFLLGFLPAIFNLQNYMYCFTTFSALAFYAMGNIIGDKFVKMKRMYLAILFIVSAMALIAMYFVSYKYLHYGATDMFDNTLPPNFALFVLAAVIGILMVLFLSILVAGNNIATKTLAFIGECSMYIFAFHLAIMTVAHKYLPYHGIAVEILLIVVSLISGCVARPIFKNLCPAVFK